MKLDWLAPILQPFILILPCIESVTLRGSLGKIQLLDRKADLLASSIFFPMWHAETRKSYYYCLLTMCRISPQGGEWPGRPLTVKKPLPSGEQL